jgi:hypothetical protein
MLHIEQLLPGRPQRPEDAREVDAPAFWSSKMYVSLYWRSLVHNGEVVPSTRPSRMRVKLLVLVLLVFVRYTRGILGATLFGVALNQSSAYLP